MRPVEVARSLERRRRTSRTEIHWIPGSSERQTHDIVSSNLGQSDWTSIDPKMVRKSKGVRHHFTGALYFWQRTGTHVWCESQFERWELLWLDYGGQVTRVWSQPMAIVFGKSSALSGHWHVPDFLALFSDGTYGLFDMRPEGQLTSRAALQFAETAKVCDELGWHYQVLTGHDRLATQNLAALSASRHHRCEPPAPIQSLLLDAARDGATRSELCVLAAPDCPPLACAWVDNLAWRRMLLLDLSSVFNSATILTTSPQAGAGATDES